MSSKQKKPRGDTTINVSPDQRRLLNIIAAFGDVKNHQLLDDILYAFGHALREKTQDPRLREIQARYNQVKSALREAAARG